MPRPQGLPFQVLHRNKWLIVRFRDIIDRDNVWMPNVSSCDSLSDQFVDRTATCQTFGADQFEGNRLLGQRIGRLVDDAHPASPYNVLNLVAV